LPERRPRRYFSAGTEPFWIYVSSRLQQTNAPRRRAWWRLRRQPAMGDNALDHGSLFDHGSELEVMPNAPDSKAVNWRV
jgi:kynureninase